MLIEGLEERLRSLEEALRRYYDVYEERLRRVEERLRASYHPLWEREADVISGLLRLLGRALKIARDARSALEAGASVARVRLNSILEDARRLRDDTLYGAVKVPTEIRARILTLYMLIERALLSLGAG